jgi:hypothetical protein
MIVKLPHDNNSQAGMVVAAEPYLDIKKMMIMTIYQKRLVLVDPVLKQERVCQKKEN